MPKSKKPVYGAPAPLPNPNIKSPALGRNKGKVGKPKLMPTLGAPAPLPKPKKPVYGAPAPLPKPKKPVYGAPAPLPNPNIKSPNLRRDTGNKVGKPKLMPSGPRKPVPFAPGKLNKGGSVQKKK